MSSDWPWWSVFRLFNHSRLDAVVCSALNRTRLWVISACSVLNLTPPGVCTAAYAKQLTGHMIGVTEELARARCLAPQNTYTRYMCVCVWWMNLARAVTIDVRISGSAHSSGAMTTTLLPSHQSHLYLQQKPQIHTSLSHPHMFLGNRVCWLQDYTRYKVRVWFVYLLATWTDISIILRI